MAKKKTSTSEIKIPKTSNNEFDFSELTNALSKFSNGGDILEDSTYAKINEWISTGSYIVNAALSGSLFGGMPNNRSFCLAGEEGAGKTYLAMSICRNAQKMGYFVVYCDSEGSMDPEFARRLGVDPTRMWIEPIGTIEEFSTYASNFNKTLFKLREENKLKKVIVVLDSLGNMSSTKEKEDTISGNDKRDMTKQQKIRGTFRVNGLDFSKLGVPFIICNHVYEKVGSYIPGKEVSGGGGIKYNASVIFQLTKSKLDDKESNEKAANANVDATRVGIIVTITPVKQRFARPIKVQMHIPFYKKPNPFVGLEKFVSWEACGIIRGKALSEKDYKKLTDKEQETCNEFLGEGGEILYAYPKDTSRTLVCKHLKGEVPLGELFTEKVFTEDVLKELDENVIKKIFMLPSIESLEDLKDLSAELGGEEEECELCNLEEEEIN